MNHRLRPLLNLAHFVNECTNCGRWSEHGCDPAHENGIEAGKGQSIKGQDHRHAATCNRCHSWYDSGSTQRDPSDRYEPTFEGKAEFFNRAYKRTQDIYWSNGWLQVAKRARPATALR